MLVIRNWLTVVANRVGLGFELRINQSLLERLVRGHLDEVSARTVVNLLAGLNHLDCGPMTLATQSFEELTFNIGLCCSDERILRVEGKHLHVE